MSAMLARCGWVVSVATSILLSDEDDSVANSHNVFCGARLSDVFYE